MNRRNLLFQSGALLTAALAGCTKQGQPVTTTVAPSETATEPIETATETPTETPIEERTIDDERLSKLAAGNASFAIDLYQYLARENGGNQFFSPYSISAALAMAYAGARGETATQIRDTLNYTLGKDVHEAFADHRTVLQQRETTDNFYEDEPVDAFKLRSANAIWSQEGFQLTEEFLTTLEDSYGAEHHRADFSARPESERQRINEWVDDRTGGRIDELLPEGAISPMTMLVLTNAIHFLASWYQDFDPEETVDGIFTSLDGTESTVPMMHQQMQTYYMSSNGADVVELAYVGREVSMVLILPPECEFETFEQQLTVETLSEMFTKLRQSSVDLTLPRFEFESSLRLSEALADLGMPAAFSDTADFSGMVPGSGGLPIDEVYHDGTITVDETGTEAAAATAIAFPVSGLAGPFEVRFDRPFLFCIRDRPTDAVLFFGRVVEI